MNNSQINESINDPNASISNDSLKQGGLGGIGSGMMGSLPPLGGPNLANSIAQMKIGQRSLFG